MTESYLPEQQEDEMSIEQHLERIAADLRSHATPIADLVHHPENPHVGNVDAIKESLERFGQVRPVCVQRSTGFIVAGNHTTKAARELGWTHIAAVAVDLSDDDALAYLVADNRLAALGRDNQELLHAILRRAAGTAGGLAGVGFDTDDLLSMAAEMPSVPETEMVLADDLSAHPQNYREHPEEQLLHLRRSLEEHGFYRNVVVANDGTVLAGHGLLAAAKAIGVRKVPVTRLACGPNDPEALRVLAGDNEMPKSGARDDRKLTEVLRQLAESEQEDALVGTGHDAATLTNLVFVSRPGSEVEGYDAAAEWVGMPEFEPQADRIRLVLAFDSEDQREELARRLELVLAKKTGSVWSAWWPPREQEDLQSVRFERAGTPASAPVDTASAGEEATAGEAATDGAPEPVAPVDDDYSSLPDSDEEPDDRERPFVSDAIAAAAMDEAIARDES